MSVTVRELGLDGVLEICPEQYKDSRGFFCETWSQRSHPALDNLKPFVQDNHSLSREKGVLRGLHYQLPPHAQDKLVRVVRGAILDVAVDIRRGSSTFGRWVALELSGEKWNQILVPKGFAHGFVTLVPDTEVIYKVTDYYTAECDRAIRFDDPDLAITWPLPVEQISLSDKDRAAPILRDAETFTFQCELAA
ncbi:dTDP-4-dehydrorhamnose 3,5-epimerase [Mesorhizobium sp. RP14(2022)]|uniref:dTDP-4-dehydrorhamnose 3,5-epimerase n=1 Tax=Mesorhizobium liriopis TaxID=2953882 RepID=A0ABT1C5Q6_9HYPH|nr:dTDP-4-dehydrorhamnose 3,5-epimerase [Mesorhizobium liriopis]MCO6050155.1 dTDP-4-dehydrorhamnose 3,5-epimerase [Mesorhizobium liriopis]